MKSSSKVLAGLGIFLLFSVVLVGCSAYQGKGRTSEPQGAKTNPEPKHLLTVAEFQTEVLDAEGIILVDFSAHWCPPCKKLSPLLDQLAAEMKDKIKLVKIYEDDPGAKTQGLFEKYKIDSIPALKLMKDGKIIAAKGGYMPYETLKAWVEENI